MIGSSLSRQRQVWHRPRSEATAFASHLAASIEADIGGWRGPTRPKEIEGVAHAGAMAVAGPERSGADRIGVRAVVTGPEVERQRLAAAGYLDADNDEPLHSAQLRPIAGPLVAQAFAPDAGRRDRLILISSANAGEGKTFTAVNLALALSQDGGRPVLLIDADARTAGAADVLGLSSAPGLSDALGDDRAILDQLIRPTGLDNLTFLGPGTAPAAMARLLASRRAAHLIRELLARVPGGLVVVDGPAMLAGSESAALAMYAGQVVLVVAAGRTAAPAIEQSVGLLGERANLWLLLACTPTTPHHRPGARTRLPSADFGAEVSTHKTASEVPTAPFRRASRPG